MDNKTVEIDIFKIRADAAAAAAGSSKTIS
jgi:hypothetical protein